MSFLNLQKQDGNPLFLGEDLGLQEYTQPRYPQLEHLALLQRSQFWTETEIDMTKDAAQWPTLSADSQEISILNLSWQIMADSVVGRSPFTVLMPFVSNPELEGMLIQWGYFENLHSRAYSNMVQTVFPEPQVIIDRVKSDTFAYERLSCIRTVFERLYSRRSEFLLSDRSDPTLNMDLMRDLAVVATYALESLQFYCSFACTFMLAEQDVLMGFSDNLKLISKDEAIHTRMSLATLKILANDHVWGPYTHLFRNDALVLLEGVRLCERDWSEYLFSNGRCILGLNPPLLNDYLDYVSGASYEAAGFGSSINFNVPSSNPLSWIDKYLNPGVVQVAPQERQITNYRVGQVDGSLGDLSDVDF